MKRHDLIVIGSGAGLMVLEEALKQGLDCAIVENGKFGGTCLTKGCIPSKMLVYPADFIREMEGSMRFGVKAGKPEIDWQLISRRMWEQIDLHKHIEASLQEIPNLTVYKGTGAFVGPMEIRVRYGENQSEEEIQGEKIIIATGARSHVPTINGLEEAGYMTSETFFGDKYPDKPWKSLVIIGSGAISTEFAHIFSAFGTKVTILARSSRILKQEEEEISEFVEKKFAHDGIEVLTNSVVSSVRKEGGMKHVLVENRETGKTSVVECEEILVASGTESTGDLLSLGKAGVAVDQQGWIITNPYLETSQENIWALGDINGKYQLRHKANHEAQILIQNLFSGEDKKETSYDAVPWAIFTHPQVAHVGMTERELKEKGIPCITAKNHYSEVVGGRAMGFRDGDPDDGFVKMIVSQERTILGAHIVGPQAAALVQPFVYLMNAGHRCRKKLLHPTNAHGMDDLRIMCPQIGTYDTVNDAMIIHPSLSELTGWVFEKIDLME